MTPSRYLIEEEVAVQGGEEAAEHRHRIGEYGRNVVHVPEACGEGMKGGRENRMLEARDSLQGALQIALHQKACISRKHV